MTWTKPERPRRSAGPFLFCPDLSTQAKAYSGIGLAAKFLDDMDDVNLLLGRHARPGGIHPTAKVHGFIGIRLAIANERQKLCGVSQVFLLRVHERAAKRALRGPVRRDR